MKAIYKLLSSLFLGLSLVFFISPIFLYWFIHGDYDRYIWIINGPFPFSHFGGGPFQLWMGTGLVFSGLIFVIISFVFSILNKKSNRY
ncbi:hypothetical protein [Paraliobacillus quinghaiensis]|uniref:hypothetical protein n=1 Tax=Paraliobacillus quinghaiensis TaxID=470815 RepID=UPI001E4C02D7|nr:hypothetical protein [Paraliobacillus quinghaiensis]